MTNLNTFYDISKLYLTKYNKSLQSNYSTNMVSNVINF